MVGQTLLHYRILKKLGEGGMGEVYLAEDTRLKRQVAIKVLPESLRGSPERLARFRTEAEAAARLKHPNIAPIFALEEAVPEDDGAGGDDVSVRARHASPQREHHDDLAPTLFIVMEFVEGQPLYAHIPQDGMDLETFFSIFIPLSDALSHAHTHDVTHRDLKPGNIMIAEDGTPKILDFGLARITRPEPEEASPGAVDSDASTMTMDDPNAPLPHPNASQTPPRSLTEGMQFMGTPAYMSPEQAQRQKVDHRTDLFSFGVVIYEALTGKRPFQGDTLESLIGHILVADPKPVTTVKPVTPYTLWQVIRTCLRKDRGERTQTARRLHADLRDVQQEVAAGTVLVDASAVMQAVKPTPLWRQPAAIGLAAVTLIVGLVAAWLLKPSTKPPLRKFTIAIEPVGRPEYDGPAISPDGTMIVYAQGEPPTLWIRNLDAVTPRKLPDTMGCHRPFWSPNSDFVAYFKWEDPTLRKMAAKGGPSIPLCELPGGSPLPRGGVWRPDGIIVFGVAGYFSAAGVLYSVSSQGGEPAVFAEADSNLDRQGLIYPSLLPDGSVLYAAVVGEESGALMVQKGQERRMVMPGRDERIAFPAYSPSGHIVYQRGFPESQGVWAVPFDGTEVTGEPFPVDAAGGYPTVSSDGTLVYRSTGVRQGQLAWVDRRGAVQDRIGQPQGEMLNPVLSPDERRVAVSAGKGGNNNIWVHDIKQNIASQLTFDPADNGFSVWSPEGDQIAYTNYRSGTGDIYLISSDGLDEPRVLTATPMEEWVADWSSDGQYVVYSAMDLDGIWNCWLIPLTGDQEPVQFTDSPHLTVVPRISPDGRYVAYHSDESGQSEIYVRSFPSGRGKWRVSTGGGVQARWNGKGDELFYVERSEEGDRLMVVPIDTDRGFTYGAPQLLFTSEKVGTHRLGEAANYFYDVTDDGQRFVVVQEVEAATQQTTVTIVQNWAVRSN